MGSETTLALLLVAFVGVAMSVGSVFVLRADDNSSVSSAQPASSRPAYKFCASDSARVYSSDVAQAQADALCE